MRKVVQSSLILMPPCWDYERFPEIARCVIINFFYFYVYLFIYLFIFAFLLILSLFVVFMHSIYTFVIFLSVVD